METNDQQYLAREKLGRLMGKYAVPCIISLLVGALYNIVDQIFIANADYLGSTGNAANTVVFPLTVIALAIAVCIGDGCCAHVSSRLGSGKLDEARRSFGNAIVLAAGSGVVLCAVYLLLQDPLITVFGGTVNGETFRQSQEYFFWITTGIPFYMFGQAMNPVIRADGSPRFAMVSTLAGAAVNIVLDPVFIFVFRWGMMGAAVATVLGNVGFLGLPLVSAIFPDQPIVACYSTVYALSMNLVVFTLGVFLITRDKRYMSLKSAIVNPTSLTILFALPFYFLDLHLPVDILDNLALLGKMTTPLCMFTLGMRLASVDLKALFTQPYAYIGSALKLIAYPLIAYLMVYFIPGLDVPFKTCVLVLSAAPSAAIILSLAELHRCEQKNAASTLLMSTLLCALTIPLVLLVL